MDGETIATAPTENQTEAQQPAQEAAVSAESAQPTESTAPAIDWDALDKVDRKEVIAKLSWLNDHIEGAAGQKADRRVKQLRPTLEQEITTQVKREYEERQARDAERRRLEDSLRRLEADPLEGIEPIKQELKQRLDKFDEEEAAKRVSTDKGLVLNTVFGELDEQVINPLISLLSEKNQQRIAGKQYEGDAFTGRKAYVAEVIDLLAEEKASTLAEQLADKMLKEKLPQLQQAWLKDKLGDVASIEPAPDVTAGQPADNLVIRTRDDLYAAFAGKRINRAQYVKYAQQLGVNPGL